MQNSDEIVKKILKAKTEKEVNDVIDFIPYDELQIVIKLLASRINLNNIMPDKVWLPVSLDHPVDEYDPMPYPDGIMESVRQTLGLEEDDDSMDDEIKEMSKLTVLEKVLQWEGIIGYEGAVQSWVQEIWNIDLNSLEG